MTTFTRVNILGVGISAVNLPQAVEEIDRWIASRAAQYVNVCAVQTVMACQRDARLRRIVNASGLATPDGMPLVWLSRMLGHRQVSRVYGPDLMLTVCERSQSTGSRHFFYGGAPGVADLLVRNLTTRYPGLVVSGTHAPPYRPADTAEDREVLAKINAAAPDIVWVGLGTPKQDYWVARHRPLLDAPVLIAVGAAFDFHAGLLPQAPRWIQRNGLEWLFRLVHEPRRLAFRYLVDSPWFVLKVALQSAGLRRYDLD